MQVQPSGVISATCDEIGLSLLYQQSSSWDSCTAQIRLLDHSEVLVYQVELHSNILHKSNLCTEQIPVHSCVFLVVSLHWSGKMKISNV